ncbi:MAG: hypothetical protein ABSB42_13300 [Tepidisphaeraceae bacterium]|jgi:hypothetical protein
MKRMAIEDLGSEIARLIKTAPKEKILLTRNGQPFAFVSDASAYDWEDIGYMNDPEFWKMIRERRNEKGGVPLEQVKTELAQRESNELRAVVRTKPNKKSRTKHSRSAA